MQESITASLLRLLILLLILAAILVAGWHEPLRNRFMSRPAIEAFTEPPTGDWMWERGRTSIDQGAYKSDSTSRWRGSRQGGTALDR